jgi:hypothetical protein
MMAYEGGPYPPIIVQGGDREEWEIVSEEDLKLVGHVILDDLIRARDCACIVLSNNNRSDKGGDGS